jgi:hypothetical protein
MSLKISLLHASYMSKFQARSVRDLWLGLANNPDLVEHCLGFEDSDIQVREEFDLPIGQYGFSHDGLTKFATTISDGTPSAVRNWNMAARISTGKLLLGIADDLVPEKDWDLRVIDLVGKEFNSERLWKLTDSRCDSFKASDVDDSCPRHPLITRSLYNKKGFYFDPRYFSVGPDNEWLIVSLKSGILRDGRSIKLHHTVGSIVDNENRITCWCFSPNFSKSFPTNSQERMHSEVWVKSAQDIFLQWSIPWLLVGWIGVQKSYGKNLIGISQKRFGWNPRIIILRTVLQRKLAFVERIRIILGLGHEFIAILRSRRDIRY